MKQRLFTIALVLISVALIAAQTPPEPTPPEPPQRGSLVIAADVYVRSGPGRDYVPVGRVVEGDRLIPLSRNTAGDWVLIQYRNGFGWIRRDLGQWVENIDALPVLDIPDLTPSPIPGLATPRPFFPTETPVGNWVRVIDAESAYVRAGPGRTYLRLGQLYDGDLVEPVGRDAETAWVLIRFGEGFGWIARNLVRWRDNLENLPVLSDDDLTPTATYTSTSTPTNSLTPTNTSTATNTATETATSTVTASVTPTVTETAISSPTRTLFPTQMPTSTPSLTLTVQPSATSTLTKTETPPHTATATSSPTQRFTASPEPTETPSNTATLMPTASGTPTEVPSSTPTPTFTETSVPTAAAIVIVPTQTRTPTQIPTNTPPPTQTATSLPPTNTATLVTVTSTEVAAIAVPTSAPTIQPTPTEPPTGDTAQVPFPVEALVGGVLMVIVFGYVGLYWRGLIGAERYANGFVVDTCPVCSRGNLVVESRSERVFGIPNARRTVQCTVCRSVLRETGNRRWRYAVDPIENPALYERFNGREIDEETLKVLASQAAVLNEPPVPRPPATPPAFVDDEDV